MKYKNEFWKLDEFNGIFCDSERKEKNVFIDCVT